MSGTRCFVAIDITNEVRRRLEEARCVLLQHAPTWGGEKWVAEHNLHITLKFLGALNDSSIEEVRGAVKTAVAEASAFELGLAGLLAVPRARRCSMIWARFADTDGGCAALAARIAGATEALGSPAENRKFAPHVTVVRARRPQRLADEALTSANAVIAMPPISMSVLSATLFASTLTPAGSIYEALDSWALPAEA